MSSPIPPDPYVALGVTKDADISAIRSAHRKLVLKHHPDRIQDPALKEKGKDEFQKIQQAYELLSDPVKRSRYDDKIKLAELRRDTMMNGGSSRSYPMRPAPPSSSNSREYREDDRTFYEERRPRDTRDPRDYRDPPRDTRDSYFDSRDRFDEPLRTSSRKYDDYERKTTPKAAEKERTARTPKANWTRAFTAVNVGNGLKREVESRRAKANVERQETRDREKRKARMEKEQQTRNPYVVSDDDSDSDTATRVTTSTIRPNRSSPRQTRAPEPSSKRSSGATRHFSYSEDDSDDMSYSSRKWESHHESSKNYIERASGGRPGATRSESGTFWQTGRKSGSDGERRPTSSKGRHSYDELPPRPPMPTHTSAPSGLKNRVNERTPAQRRSATGSYPTRDREREAEPRKDVPGIHRSQTMPAGRPVSRKDNAPSKPSGLKETQTHTHTQDSGYGSSSSPHTPELREESPARRPPIQRSTRYAIVDPSSDDDRSSRVKKVFDDDSDNRRRRYQQSPEPDRRESDRRKEKADRPDRPRVDTRMRSKTTRDVSAEMPSMRRAESARYDTRSPKESPAVSRNNSNRERLFAEMSPDEKEPSSYKYPAGDRINVRPQFQEARYSNYGRDSPDRRTYDYVPNSKFHDNIRSERRASVQGHG